MSDATTPYELLRLFDLRCRERAAGLPAQQENPAQLERYRLSPR